MKVTAIANGFGFGRIRCQCETDKREGKNIHRRVERAEVPCVV